ncbi:22823_t:CDS:2 [Dentiscutata erythropus]|uniref:22823_t:CDS:1 n=1 Tax=Dentiscutata erythropus TaxID=1348616 RepID=A0A9N9J9D5_9GLOM|nr:22823_t:CDS:2 [Dentiscutata erythropus]
MIPPFFTSSNDKNLVEKDSPPLEQSFVFLDDKGINNDMHIIAGYDWNRKIFKVHTSILKDRSADEMLLPNLVNSLESILIDNYLKQSSPEIEVWLSCLITINKDQFLSRFEDCVYKMCLEFFKEIIPGNVNIEIESRNHINTLLEMRNMYITKITAFGSVANVITSLDKSSDESSFEEVVSRIHLLQN